MLKSASVKCTLTYQKKNPTKGIFTGVIEKFVILSGVKGTFGKMAGLRKMKSPGKPPEYIRGSK